MKYPSKTSLTFLVYTYILFIDSGKCSRYAAFAGPGSRYTGNVDYTNIQRSDTGCARTCSTNSSCKAFNVKLEKGNYLCEYFGTIPVNLGTEVTSTEPDTSAYYEKICSTPAFAFVAAESDEEDDYNYMSFVGLGDSSVISIFQISKDLKNHTETVKPYKDLYALTNGFMKAGLESVAMTTIPPTDSTQNTQSITWFIKDDVIYCRHEKTDCSTMWPKKVTEIFGEQVTSIDAILSCSGDCIDPNLWVFADEKIYGCSVKAATFEWNVQKVYDRNVDSPGNIWLGIPQGIIAAAWVSMLENTAAILFTREFFAVYNVTTRSMVYRGHICL